MRQKPGIPARMLVTTTDGSLAELTDGQYAVVAAAYNAFQNNVENSIIRNHAQRAVFPGIEVKMTHLFGVNVVRVVVARTLSEDGISGIGILTQDAEGNVLRVVLTPGGSYGSPNGKWRERKVPALYQGQRFWQSSETQENYAVVGDSIAFKGNSIAATSLWPLYVVFSAKIRVSPSEERKYIVSASPGVAQTIHIDFYDGALTELGTGAPKVLDRVARKTVNGWELIGADPAGKRILAARLKEYYAPNGTTLWRMVIDRVSWFDIKDRDLSESTIVMDRELELLSADPPMPRLERLGDPIPQYGSYHYKYIASAHIDFDGNAVVHTHEIRTAEDGANGDNNWETDTGIYWNGWLNYTRTEANTYRDTSGVEIAMADFVDSCTYVGSSAATDLHAGAVELDTASYYSKWTTEGTTTGALYQSQRHELVVLIESVVDAEKTRDIQYRLDLRGTSEYADSYDKTTYKFAGTVVQKLKILYRGNVVKTFEARPKSVSREIFFHYNPQGGDNSVVVEPTVDPGEIWLTDGRLWREHLYNGGFFFTCLSYMTAYSPSGGSEDPPLELIGAAVDANTGAAVLQVRVHEELHWVVLDDAGPKPISAASALIPAASRATTINSV